MDKSFKKLLSSVGVIPLGTGGGDGQLILGPAFIPVLIDGVVFGGMKASRGADIVAQLRLLKVTGGTDTTTRIDPTTELAFFPYSALGGAYAGLYIFTQPGRLIRPVLSLKTRTVEWIGPMEQVFMDIACLAEDRRAETTHMELGPGIMLSQVASMTPFRYRTACCEYCERLLMVLDSYALIMFDFSLPYFDALLDLIYSTLLYSTLLYYTILYSTLLYSTLLYSTLLFSTLLNSTLPYPTLSYPTLPCLRIPYPASDSPSISNTIFRKTTVSSSTLSTFLTSNL